MNARLRILVVEDDAIIGMLLEDMLAEMGHDVCGVATTEAGAVAAAARERPDLMIVDARLGTGSGLAAMDQIQRSRPMPHVVISGGQVFGAAPNAVLLRKPFLADALERAIAQALGRGA